MTYKGKHGKEFDFIEDERTLIVYNPAFTSITKFDENLNVEIIIKPP